MTFGLGLGLGGRSAKSAAVFDPATLSLTGWWRASYASSPWVGVASAGTSLGRDLSEATNPPSVGAALNSLDPADFDGTNDQLTSAATLGDYINANAFSAWCLFNADTADADFGAGSRYNNPQFVTDITDAYFTFGFSDAGVHVSNDASVTEIVVACATGGWHLAQAKYNGTTLALRVDSGAWSTAAGSDTGGLARTMRFGCRYNGAVSFFDGRIADLAIADSAFSDGTFDNIKSYVNARYALAL